MAYQYQLGTLQEGSFALGSLGSGGYAANDSTRPLRYYRDPSGFVQLSGFIRRTGVTSNIAQGARFGIISGDGIPADMYPPGKGFIDMMCRTSEIPQVLGMSIIANPEVIGSQTWPRGSFICIAPVAFTLTQNQSWVSLDMTNYRV